MKRTYLSILLSICTLVEAYSEKLHSRIVEEHFVSKKDTLFFKKIRKPWRQKSLILGHDRSILNLHTGGKIKCIIVGTEDSSLIVRKYKKLNSTDHQKLAEEKKKIIGTYQILENNKLKNSALDSLKNRIYYSIVDTILFSEISKIKVSGKLTDTQRKRELTALGTVSSLSLAGYLSIKANILSMVPYNLIYENSVGIRLLLGYPILLITVQMLTYKNIIRLNKWSIMQGVP